LCSEDYEYKKYMAKAEQTQKESIKIGWKAGLTIAMFIATIPMCSALTFYSGSVFIDTKLVKDATGQLYNVGDVITIFFASLMSGLTLGQAFPVIRNISEGVDAAASIFGVIERVPQTAGLASSREFSLQKAIVFENVRFAYPARPDPVLNGISLELKAGKVNALVGESGSGKSTITQLLMRLYDPMEGEISVDGSGIAEFSLQGMLERIGYVGQEPTLFATSIRENVTFGLQGVTEQAIWEALEKAEAKEFVKGLP
jgi:ATP-binding cassette subfamily B (MDR/TAP) protein 1